MIRSNVKFTFRYLLKKEKFIFIISVLGIAVSISSFLLFSEHVKYEENFDTFFANSEDVYRVQSDFTNKASGEILKFPLVPATLSELVRERVPEVQEATWISPKLGSAVNRIDKTEVFNLEYTFLADSNYFKVFPIQFTNGQQATSLNQNNSIVLSESKAVKIFGNTNPIGQQLKVSWAGFEGFYSITGVFKDIPENSHLIIDALITNKEMKEQQREWNYHYTYFKVYKEKDISQIQKKTKQLYEELYHEDLVKENLKVDIGMMPVENIHLFSDYSREIKDRGDLQLVGTIKIFSILILIICIINYLNLSSAIYSKRRQEIGLRRLLGSTFRKFQFQLFIENSLNITLGVVGGLIILLIIIPFYSRNFGINISYSTFMTLKNAIVILAFILLISVLAMLFPLQIFFSKNKKEKRRSWLLNVRNLFIAIQFMLVIAVIFSMLVINGQLNYMKNKDLGFEKSGVIFMNCPPLKMSDDEKLAKVKLFTDELKTRAGIVNVSNSLTIPGRFYNNLSSFSNKINSTEKVVGYHANADYNFLDTYHIKLLSGRNFYEDFKDNYGIIINKILSESLGFKKPSDAIGKIISMNDKDYTVIGVIQDSHQNHFKEKIEPWALIMVYKTSTFVSIKINPKVNTEETLGNIKTTYAKVFPGAAFEYKYMDEFFGRLFKNDQNLSNLSIIVSFVMLILAIMGLISISSFVISQRIKEIAIRKVLGSTFIQNLKVLLHEYLIIMAVAVFVSISICTFSMIKWLQNFAYRTEISLIMIIVPILVVFTITILIILYNALKVEASNPIKSLKSS